MGKSHVQGGTHTGIWQTSETIALSRLPGGREGHWSFLHKRNPTVHRRCAQLVPALQNLRRQAGRMHVGNATDRGSEMFGLVSHPCSHGSELKTQRHVSRPGRIPGACRGEEGINTTSSTPPHRAGCWLLVQPTVGTSEMKRASICVHSGNTTLVGDFFHDVKFP